ncbi:hypothetical protein TSUD_146510 [Trifolium subterraneum]|uniref:Uncharacterized protein n=1 Tax=Trifolium subterraneum TaxID=3900 RepID=A0A2Z6NEP4_TRISU|nr:hypothetical protein TSUD_146510 [Trifolium subterraneum]
MVYTAQSPPAPPPEPPDLKSLSDEVLASHPCSKPPSPSTPFTNPVARPPAKPPYLRTFMETPITKPSLTKPIFTVRFFCCCFRKISPLNRNHHSCAISTFNHKSPLDSNSSMLDICSHSHVINKLFPYDDLLFSAMYPKLRLILAEKEWSQACIWYWYWYYHNTLPTIVAANAKMCPLSQVMQSLHLEGNHHSSATPTWLAVFYESIARFHSKQKN